MECKYAVDIEHMIQTNQKYQITLQILQQIFFEHGLDLLPRHARQTLQKMFL